MSADEKCELSCSLKTFFNTHFYNKKITIIVAVSGGPDSMSLLKGLHQLNFSQHGQDIQVVTINHQLRLESAQEANMVADYCKKLKTEHHTLLWRHTQKLESGIQEKAREARYGLIANFAKNYKNPIVFMAHHANDQAETVLMRLKKGSGPFGLRGMDALSDHNNLNLARPFLKLSKDTILSYAQRHNIPYINDPSNDNKSFQRVRERSFLSDHQDIQSGLLKIADKAQNYHAGLQEIIDYHLKKIREPLNFVNDKVINVVLNTESFLLLPVFLQKQILIKLIKTYGKASYCPKDKAVNFLVNILQNANVVDGYRLSGVTIFKKKNYIYL